MADKYKPLYEFSTHIGAACARKMRTFADLAEKLKMPVEDLMRQCNGKAPPSKALVKGSAKEVEIDESLQTVLPMRFERILARLAHRASRFLCPANSEFLVIPRRFRRLPVFGL